MSLAAPLAVIAEDTPPAESATEPAAAQAPADTAAAADTAPPPAKWVHGSFTADFDGVWGDGASDVNLDQTLRLQADPPKHERIHLRGALWMLEDLDSDEPRTSALRGINDASSSDVRARLLELCLEVDDVWGDSTLRLGRQRIAEGAAFNRIDGLYFKQRHAKWDWYVFGGARATVYGGVFDDLVLGGGTAFLPNDKTRLALDWYYGQEDHRRRERSVFPEAWGWAQSWAHADRGTRNLEDVLISLSAWHALTPNVELFGRVDLRDAGGDELLLNATGYVPPWNLTYDVSYRRQLSSVADSASDLGSFYRVLGSYEQYDDFRVSLHRPLTKRLTLSLEAELHDSDEERGYSRNRDYQRYAAVLAAEGLGKGLGGNVALEWWNAGQDESTWALTGELTKKWNAWQFAFGADYERYEDSVTYYDTPLLALDQFLQALMPGAYKSSPLVVLFDHWIVQTRENIYMTYLRARWAIRDNQDLSIRVTYEEDDRPQSPYWRLQTSYGIRF